MDEWRVEGFDEVRELGRGAHGRVVLARQATAGTTVAVKYLTGTSPTDLERLRGEAMLLGRVTDPHVARLYQFVRGEGGAAIVMEAVDGVPLRRVLDEHGALGPEASLVVLKGSLRGLAAAHAVGVVHRDYKPANVIVRADGLSKLIDFGIAAPAGEGGRSGTPAYMPPEQWKGQPATSTADVYAATCVFFECVTGRRPYRAADRAALRAEHLTAPIPVDEVPEQVRPLLLAGMAKDPEQRPAGALLLLEELERAARAGYGRDWEQRGVRALAASAAALAVLFPLAAGAGTAGAAGGAAAGGAAGGAAAAGTGGGLLATVGGKAALAVAGTVLVAGAAGGAVVLSGGGDDATPANGTVRIVAQNETLKDLPVAVRAQYASVTGYRDPRVQETLNRALRAPLDYHIRWMRGATKTMLSDPQFKSECVGNSTVNTTAKLGLAGPKLASALYTFDGKTCMPSDGTLAGWAVSVDLVTGRALTTADILKPEALTASGVRTLFGRLTGTEQGFWGADGCMGQELAPRDFAPAGRGDAAGPPPPAATVFLAPDHFEINYSVEGSACVHDTLRAPYGKVRDLIAPGIAKLLPS
ncbi:Serine/threonine-protein kinase PknH [Actinomadura rubteroloni]|uniref:non-specific serine/threonine protein kinase n=1 Tax=Actinomadura rubteroloni TaxID=1926885 RepID=A0A2P4UQ20_9ACTN|nr:serine/threonine-protein kinase [Actinomadura rubteroloni]POM27147.1 Serine/threonine-protein kinase PknH [Actinomadura rubteroloni]